MPNQPTSIEASPKALIAATGCRNVYERCDKLVREAEGLPVRARVLAGEEPPQRLIAREGERRGRRERCLRDASRIVRRAERGLHVDVRPVGVRRQHQLAAVHLFRRDGARRGLQLPRG